ncbi:MAG TPA: transporter substrate-binding domain-containing protein, partial [Actinomycetota bacterium]|nr:transporter substrate-binding domain-containing protein [Actinomycetota bacterium]
MATTGRLGGFAATVIVLVGCGVPRDPDGTLDRVDGGSMRVGITERPPWTLVGDDGPAGVEVDLVEGFARSIDAETEWFEGSQAELLTSLEERELDLVVGGFTEDDAWAQQVTFTQPYATIQVSVGSPPDRPPPGDIEGDRVAAREGTPVPRLVEDAGGTPVRVEDLSAVTGLVAAEDWELRALGRVSGGLVLDESGHA